MSPSSSQTCYELSFSLFISGTAGSRVTKPGTKSRVSKQKAAVDGEITVVADHSKCLCVSPFSA